MNDTESLLLQSLQLSVDRLSLEIARQRQEAQSRGQYADLPEWIDIEQAVNLKRGPDASVVTYRQKLFLQPCCGRNYKMVGGRRCWKKDDVIAWLSITDEELKNYAEKHQANLPEVYQRRGRVKEELTATRAGSTPAVRGKIRP
jgi:hypothetical protein